MLAAILVSFLRFYQRFLSFDQGIPSRLVPLKFCRYYPTCSQYAIDAIRKYGAARGSLLAVKRVARCHPFHEGGFDPVP